MPLRQQTEQPRNVIFVNRDGPLGIIMQAAADIPSDRPVIRLGQGE